MKQPALGVFWIFGIQLAAVSLCAQEVGQDVDPYLELLRIARESAPTAEFVIERNGEPYDVTKLPGCLGPVERRNGLAKVDCSAFDGPVYYFDEQTRVVTQECSIWARATENCPPRQWPVETGKCDGRAVTDISGTWRLHSYATSSGYIPFDGDVGSLTISADAVIFHADETYQFVRPATIVSRDGPRYELELGDDSGAKERIAIELLQCGFLIDAESKCTAFCKNFRNELVSSGFRDTLLRMLSEYFGIDEPEEVEKFLEEAMEQPIFIDRSYYRQVASD